MEKIKRDYLFDNLKALLIFLVVLGHMIEPYIYEDNLFKFIYIGIYAFHMPLFIFISGYFSKNLEKTRVNAFKKCIIPYLVWNSLYVIFISKTFKIMIFQPSWIYWFLLSLFLWKVFIGEVVKSKYGLLIVVILSLYVGLFPEVNRFMSLSRTIVFFPYFILGYYCKEHHISIIKKMPKIVSIIGIAILMGITYIVFTKFNISAGFLYGADAYSTLGKSNIEGIAIRLFIYIIAIGISVFFISIITNKEMSISTIGQNTLLIYVLHPYAKIFFEKNIEIIGENILISITLLIILSMLTVIILGNNYLNKNIKVKNKSIVKHCFPLKLKS